MPSYLSQPQNLSQTAGKSESKLLKKINKKGFQNLIVDVNPASQLITSWLRYDVALKAVLHSFRGLVASLNCNLLYGVAQPPVILQGYPKTGGRATPTFTNPTTPIP